MYVYVYYRLRSVWLEIENKTECVYADSGILFSQLCANDIASCNFHTY